MLEDFPTMEVLIDKKEIQKEKEEAAKKRAAEIEDEMVKEEQAEMVCPKCKHAKPDFGGFGMLHCEVCGYCTHPSYYEGRCGLCGAGEPIEPVKIDTAKFKEKGDLY
jgi:hypothetical protein